MCASAKPLSGLNIIVTRSGKQAGSLSDKLKEKGANVIEIPVIAFLPPASWEALDASIKNIASYDWILFASVNAVDAFFSRAQTLGLSTGGPQVAAIGPATERALSKYRTSTDFRPPSFIAESMVDEFPGYPNLSGVRILWPRTNIGRKFILEKLTEAGAHVDALEAYRTSLPENHEAVARQVFDCLKQKRIDFITLASAQTARNLAELMRKGAGEGGETSLSELLGTTFIATIGPETSLSARKHLGKVTVEAQEHTMDGLVEAICRSQRGGD